MKWISTFTHPKGWQFVIEEQTLRNITDKRDILGYYLYVYENGKNIYDYLQDTSEIARQQAYEDFGIPLTSWRREG